MNWVKKALIGLFVLIGVMGTAVTIYSESTVNGISENIVRLHIVAESDSDIDQEIKLKVRDEVMEYLTGKLDLSESIEETVKKINEELPNVEKIARDVLEENGHEGVASAQYGKFSFPTKQYENIELPAGNYNALRITLGSGKGKNWWCVVFPPLCFADSANGKISEEADEKLKETLSDDQYSIITSTDDDSLPVRFKFKLVEMVQETKNIIGNIISGIFG